MPRQLQRLPKRQQKSCAGRGATEGEKSLDEQLQDAIATLKELKETDTEKLSAGRKTTLRKKTAAVVVINLDVLIKKFRRVQGHM